MFPALLASYGSRQTKLGGLRTRLTRLSAHAHYVAGYDTPLATNTIDNANTKYGLLHWCSDRCNNLHRRRKWCTTSGAPVVGSMQWMNGAPSGYLHTGKQADKGFVHEAMYYVRYFWSVSLGTSYR